MSRPRAPLAVLAAVPADRGPSSLERAVVLPRRPVAVGPADPVLVHGLTRLRRAVAAASRQTQAARVE